MTARASLLATLANCMALAMFPLAASLARAGDPQRVTFDAALLRGARSGAVDLSAFERGAAIPPGEHEVEVVRNGAPVGRRRVRFDAADGGTPLACVDRSLVTWLDVAIARLSADAHAALESDACISVETLHPAARADFDIAALTLHLSIPQALLLRRDSAIDPATLDAGISALRVNYAASIVQQAGDPDARHASLHLDAGANAGAWRWRHRGTHTWSKLQSRRSQVLASTLERDVARLDARLTFGDLFAAGVGFDAIALRGVHFRSDDRMAPPDATHPAPAIRGTADTDARVQVRQAGLLLLDVPVSPGPFVLDDVRPLARGGALQVQIVESDGRTRSFEVPWAALPGLLPAGRARFDLAAGTWRAEGHRGDAPVFQGGMQRGLHDRLTLRVAAQLAPDYARPLAGAIVATRFGAMSLDRAHARSLWRGVRTTGASTRLGWSTQITPTRARIASAHGTARMRATGRCTRRCARDVAPIHANPGSNASASKHPCTRHSARVGTRCDWGSSNDASTTATTRAACNWATHCRRAPTACSYTHCSNMRAASILRAARTSPLAHPRNRRGRRRRR